MVRLVALSHNENEILSAPMLQQLRNGNGNDDCDASKFLNTTFNDVTNSYLFSGM